jgi:hypothetical protein
VVLIAVFAEGFKVDGVPIRTSHVSSEHMYFNVSSSVYVSSSDQVVLRSY